MRLVGSVLVPKENLFHAFMMLGLLLVDLHLGYEEQEFVEPCDRLEVDQLQLDTYVASITALLIDTLDEKTNRELATYAAEKVGIEFEDGCIFEPSSASNNLSAVCISLPKKFLFAMFVELQQYDEFGDTFDPSIVLRNTEVHSYLRAQMHGGLRFQNAHKILNSWLHKNTALNEEFLEFERRTTNLEVNIWK